MSYILEVKKSAIARWGSEAVTKFSKHIEQTAGAVYGILTYPLDSEVEPITKIQAGES